MTNEKIIDRIKKVLAKANSTDSEAEAEMLMAKVHEMLQEHNFSMLDLELADTEDPAGVTENIASWLVNDSWMRKLTFAIAQYYGCTTFTIHLTKNKSTIHVLGRESARITTQLMVPYIRKQVMGVARELVRQGRYRNDRIAARRIANALISRIWRLIQEEQVKEERRVQSGGRELVPVDFLKGLLDRHYPNRLEGRKTSISTDDIALKAAEGISLYRQTGTNQKLRIAG